MKGWSATHKTHTRYKEESCVSAASITCSAQQVVVLQALSCMQGAKWHDKAQAQPTDAAASFTHSVLYNAMPVPPPDPKLLGSDALPYALPAP